MGDYMKTVLGLAAALAALAGVAHAETAPASAWQVYASGGYTYLHASGGGASVSLGGLTGRIGARYGANLGVEGEGAFGVVDDTISNVKIKLSNEFAVFGVGYLPLSPNTDLLARIGYGHAKITASGFGATASSSGNLWAVGVGGQYHVDAHNTARLDYTRYESTESGGGHYDTATLSYVYRF